MHANFFYQVGEDTIVERVYIHTTKEKLVS